MEQAIIHSFNKDLPIYLWSAYCAQGGLLIIADVSLASMKTMPVFTLCPRSGGQKEEASRKNDSPQIHGDLALAFRRLAMGMDT